MECVQCARTPPGVERDSFFESVGLLPQPDFAQCHVQSPVQIESTPSGVGLRHLFGTSAFSLPLGNFACFGCLCMQPGLDCKRTCLGHSARGPLHEIERYVCAAKRDGLLGAECPWVSVHGTSARSLPRLQFPGWARPATHAQSHGVRNRCAPCGSPTGAAWDFGEQWP